MTADDWLRTHELDKFGPICSFLTQDFVLRVRTTFDQQKSIKLSRPSFWIYSFAHPHRQLSALRLRQLRQRRHRTMEVFLFCWWNERDRRPLGMFKNWAKKMAASIWCFRLFVVCLCLNYGMVFFGPQWNGPGWWAPAGVLHCPRWRRRGTPICQQPLGSDGEIFGAPCSLSCPWTNCAKHRHSEVDIHGDDIVMMLWRVVF